MADYRKVDSWAYSTSPGAPARPKPSTWQEGRDFAAQDAWDAEGQRARGDRDQAGAGRDAASGRANSAYEGMRSGGGAVAGMPAVGNAPLTDVGRWLGSVPDFGAGGGGGGMSVARVGGEGAPGGGMGGGSAFDDVAFDDVEDFDPTAYGTEYAKGAYADFEGNLTDRLNELEQGNAGSGRLKTGFYAGGDRGRVIDELGADFNNRLAEASTVFSGQRLSALTAGAGFRLNRAGGRDAATAERARLRQSGEQSAAELAFRERESGNNLALSRWQTGVGAARDADELNFRRTTEQGRSAFERASFLDTMSQRDRQSMLDAALQRERLAYDEYGRSAGAASEFASADREWASSERNLQDQRDEAARIRREKNPDKFTVGGGTTNAQDSYYQTLAKQLGVPFRKYA